MTRERNERHWSAMPIIRVKGWVNGEGDEGKEEKEKPTVRGKRLK